MLQKKSKIVSKYALFFLFLATVLTIVVWFSLAEGPDLKDKAMLFSVSFTLGATLSLLLMYIFSELGSKLAIVGVGWTFDYASNFAFEYLLYPLAIGYGGILVGGGIMIVLSVLISLGTIWFYDWSKRDWLGIETIKAVRDKEQGGKITRLIGWLMKKGDLIALVVLSVYSEPVKVTLYMRHGAHQFNGFSKRDWLIFTTSVIIGNVSWALAVWGGLEAFRAIF